MADPNYTAPVLNFITGEPIVQRFLDAPELFRLAIEEGCADMTEAEIADMDETVKYHMALDSAAGGTKNL